jgi:hypothetical protein
MTRTNSLHDRIYLSRLPQGAGGARSPPGRTTGTTSTRYPRLTLSSCWTLHGGRKWTRLAARWSSGPRRVTMMPSYGESCGGSHDAHRSVGPVESDHRTDPCSHRAVRSQRRGQDHLRQHHPGYRAGAVRLGGRREHPPRRPPQARPGSQDSQVERPAGCLPGSGQSQERHHRRGVGHVVEGAGPGRRQGMQLRAERPEQADPVYQRYPQEPVELAGLGTGRGLVPEGSATSTCCPCTCCTCCRNRTG